MRRFRILLDIGRDVHGSNGPDVTDVILGPGQKLSTGPCVKPRTCSRSGSGPRITQGTWWRRSPALARIAGTVAWRRVKAFIVWRHMGVFRVLIAPDFHFPRQILFPACAEIRPRVGAVSNRSAADRANTVAKHSPDCRPFQSRPTPMDRRMPRI
jgi:hypothetical protein